MSLAWSGDQFYAEATVEIGTQRYRVQRLGGLYYVIGIPFGRPLFSEAQLLLALNQYHSAQADNLIKN